MQNLEWGIDDTDENAIIWEASSRVGWEDIQGVYKVQSVQIGGVEKWRFCGCPELVDENAVWDSLEEAKTACEEWDAGWVKHVKSDKSLVALTSPE